jgi:hypothetical protein
MSLALVAAVGALIQVQGTPLRAGRLQGSAVVPLDRADGGDTPILSFLTAGEGSSGEAVRFLVDTGASSTLVSPALVRRLGLVSTPIPPAQFGLAGAGQSCRDLRPGRARLPQLRLSGGPGQLEIRGGEALVLETGGLPAGVDGVLGAPLLRQLPLWVDPRSSTVALGPQALAAAERHAITDGTAPAALGLRWHAGVPVVPMRTALGSVPALADTGAEGLFITSSLARRLAALADPSPPARPVRIAGFCGLQSAQQLTLGGISLAAQTQGQDQAVDVIATSNPIFAAVGVEAIVGQELLRDHRQLWRLDREPPSLQLW